MSHIVTYRLPDQHYPVTAIPGLVLNSDFWQEEQERAEERGIAWHLAVQEVRHCEGLQLEWNEKLRLECPKWYNPTNAVFQGDLPSNNLELALMGRLLEWKLCAMEIYTGEVWLHFYNPMQLTWQSGTLWRKTEEYPTVHALPTNLEVYAPNDEIIRTIGWVEDSEGNGMAVIEERRIGTSEMCRTVIVEDAGDSDGPVVQVDEYIREATYKKYFAE